MISPTERTPSHDLQAEAGVIGSLLLEPKRIDELQELLPKHFYDVGNRELYAAISRITESGRRLDVTILAAEIRSAGQWHLVGPGRIAEVVEKTPNAAHCRYYGHVVRERWQQRTASEGALRVASRSDRKPAETIAELRELADHIETGQQVETVSMEEACRRALARRTEERFGIATGIPAVDSATGGLQPNQLTILAAQTSVGKTAMAIQIADVAAQAGRHVLYVSLEMTAEEIISERMFKRYSQTSRTDAEIIESINQLPITWADRPGLTVANIRGLARTLKAREKLDLVIVDHIGLLREGGRDAYTRMTAISAKLMLLPKELDVPVLALSQLNRGNSKGESEKMTRPRLDHLRDSGSLEQDAHNVWLLHRELRHVEEAELIIAKQRNGPVTRLNLHYDRETQVLSGQPLGAAWRP